jgi:[NiFe] hydrogenase diaphorase moiety small subunit
MNEEITITIDGVEIKTKAGEFILRAALDAGIYIPHLCFHPDLLPHGSCRVCTVKVNGRPMASCTTPAEDGMTITSDDAELLDFRKAVIEMLFVEGNHYCMFCEMSGKCELQAVAYRLGILVPRYPYLFPKREVDASHPDVMLDHNRCILCGRCVRTSHEGDGKHVFELIERGAKTRLGIDAENNLGETNISIDDKALEVCPVGALLKKDTAYRIPVGERQYDKIPVGSQLEGHK